MKAMVIEMTEKQLYTSAWDECPRVAVVMATYNGIKYLEEQVDSIFSQNGVNVSLYVYDDCSTDGTPTLLKKLSNEYGSKGKTLVYTKGEENVGFPTSFFKALASVENSFDFYAYSDQDDVWKESKLYVAVKALELTSGNSSRPSLYFEPTTAVDENLAFLFERGLAGLHLTLQGFFVRARVAAHTMVFDVNLKRELDLVGENHCGFSHGWLALLISKCTNANLIVGEKSHTLHRRLSTSVSAGGKGFFKRLSFEWNVMFHPEVDRSPMAQILLERYGQQLGQSDRCFLKHLANYKKSCSDKQALLFSRSFDSDIRFCNIEGWISCLCNRY